jgi:threonine synthase
MWRYIEMMPADSRDEIVSFGEGWTPLLDMPRLAVRYAVDGLYTKDESVNPTGSFKARGLSAAVTMAKKLGATKLAIPSAGNAGGAMAAYASRAGLESYVFIPKETPEANILETEIMATEVHLVEGVISDAGRIVSSRKEMEGWFDVSTLKEPYRIEGKKTMGYELAEQFDWKLPDVVLYPTGGGTGLIGMWKAFEEMEQLGWIDFRRPRMVSVQSEGCAPIVEAYQQKRKHAEQWVDPKTFAAGIRVPSAVGDFLIIQGIVESNGTAVAVSEREIYEGMIELGKSEGFFYCPEGAACWAAFKRLRSQGWIKEHETVVIFNTGAGYKYTDFIRQYEARL